MGHMPPMTRAMAAQAGITKHQLYGPKYRRLFYGVFVERDVLPSLGVLVEGARLLYPDAMVTGVTALRLRGVPLGQDSPITLATESRVERAGIRTIRVKRNSPGGIASIAQAIADAELGLVEEVCVLDDLLRREELSERELAELQSARSDAWQFAHSGAASWQESRTRMVLVSSGLPSPALQHEIKGPDGKFLARVDMAWVEHKVIVEYEGQQHLTNAQQWEKDIHRYEQLEAMGWTVIRVTAASLREPAALVLRVHQALRTNGWRGPAPRLDAGWLAQVA